MAKEKTKKSTKENLKDVVQLTQEGLDKLENELNYLKTTKRIQVAEQLKIALSFGDISENSEYDAAKEEHAQLEIRISQIEELLSKAKVIDLDKIDKDKINIGSRVRLFFKDTKEEEEYMIVGKTEADAFNGKISYESPIGDAILGKKAGETVTVNIPNDTIEIEILELL